MATDGEEHPPVDEMLPDERAVIAERAVDFDELDDDDYLTTDEVSEKLGIDLGRD